jgi:hypothetical protein
MQSPYQNVILCNDLVHIGARKSPIKNGTIIRAQFVWTGVQPLTDIGCRTVEEKSSNYEQL